MNINIQRLNNSIFSGMQQAGGRGLKSTQQKMQRQEERDNQIAVFEKQKDNLKNMKCETVEEIAKKLDMFRSYNDQIAAARAAYNNEQMMHVMDESRELGEKIAKAVEKMAPKTAEERLEDIVEEVMGVEEGVLDELMDEVAEMQEELQNTIAEDLVVEGKITIEEDLQETMQGGIAGEVEMTDSVEDRKIFPPDRGLEKQKTIR
ncbi:MAG: hypothetical protein HDR06_08770 [Lachnospiraceae bacterium]|nr:hypothetical protein [Lachnospiraceae bacterium]